MVISFFLNKAVPNVVILMLYHVFLFSCTLLNSSTKLIRMRANAMIPPFPHKYSINTLLQHYQGYKKCLFFGVVNICKVSLRIIFMTSLQMDFYQ